MRICLIAEAGVNHNGDLRTALALASAAREAGADVVKFQTFQASQVASRRSSKAGYQNRTTDPGETQQEMLRRLELEDEAFRTLQDHCGREGIGFLSSPFDRCSAAFLMKDLGLRTIKLGSGEITNGPLLLDLARGGCSVLLSTGMCLLGEIEEALGVLAFGYLGEGEPCREAFRRAYLSPAGRERLQQKVTLLHCTTEYPAPAEEVNLRALGTLRDAFGLPVGYSDHTEGIAVSLGAAALGATVLEKHFTLDRTQPGPDHRASLDPESFVRLAQGVRQVEAALGESAKRPSPSEEVNRPVARKSLVAARRIHPGERFDEENLTCKRPGTGRSPLDFWDLLGCEASRGYEPDEEIRP